MLLPRNHGPEAIPQTGGVPHGTRGGVPRLVDGVHIVHPDVDKVIQGGVIERHIISPTIQLVLMKSNKASMIDQVVHRQPLLQDISEVFLRVL